MHPSMFHTHCIFVLISYLAHYEHKVIHWIAIFYSEYYKNQHEKTCFVDLKPDSATNCVFIFVECRFSDELWHMVDAKTG